MVVIIVISKKIIKLFLSYGSAQCVVILGFLVLTRLYDPHSIAYFGYAASFAVVFLSFSSLQYETAIPLIQSTQLRFTLLHITTYCVYFFAVLAVVGFLIINVWLIHLALSLSFIFVSLFILIMQGVVQIYTAFLVAEKKTHVLGYGKLIQSVSMIVLQVALPFLLRFTSPSILLVGLLVGLSLQAFYFHRLIFSIHSTNVYSIKRRHIFYLLKRYQKFPIFSSVANGIETLATAMPIFLIGPFFGAKALGVYFLIYRVFSGPSGVLNQAIGKVLTAEFSFAIRKNENVMPLFLKMNVVLIIIGMIYFFTLHFLCYWCPIFFGNQWIEAGSVLRILTLIISLKLIVSPLSFLFSLLNRNGTDLILQIFYITFTISVIYINKHAAFTYMLTQLVWVWICWYLIYWMMLWHTVSRRDFLLCAA